jgi:hypothetical protein
MQGKYMTWVSETKGLTFESPIAHHNEIKGLA